MLYLIYNTCKIMEGKVRFMLNNIALYEFVLEDILKNNLFIYIMIGFMFLGLLIKFIVNIIFRRLIKDSDNMGGANAKLLKHIKLKFESYYKLNLGVNNVDIFVDKYVYKHKVGGLLLSTWKNFGGQVIAWCALTGVIGSILGIMYNIDKVHILSTVLVGILTCSILIIVEMHSSIDVKNKILCTNLKDYLDNYLRIRLEYEYFNKEDLKKYQNEYFLNEEELSKRNQEIKEKENNMEPSNNIPFTAATKEANLEQNNDMEYLLKTLNGALYGKIDNKGEEKIGNKLIKIEKEDEKIIEEILKEYLV